MTCTSCTASVPSAARFCPRCGQALDTAAAAKPEWNRMKAPVPATGWAFLLLLVFAPLLLVVGASLGIKLIIFIGMITIGFLVLFLLLGALF
jgi:hypothetical protein